MTGVKLEARPHGFTEDDTPVYCRTGKVKQNSKFEYFLCFGESFEF